MSAIVVRPAREDDVAAAAEVLNEHSRRLYGAADTTAAELREDWTAPDVDFPDNVLVAERDGHLVGYADVIPRAESAWIDVRAVDPSAYTPLLDAITKRAETIGREHVRGWSPHGETELRQVYEAAGYRVFRHSFRMEIDLDDAAEPTWPEGYGVRPFRPGDERAVWEAHQESFADTWGFAPDPYETWAHWHLGEYFQPENWFFAVRGDEVAGVAMTRVPAAEPEIGWVNIIGVRPSHRRRGVALALLVHVFRHYARLGKERVGLGVDAENPTGAVALYERAGMHVARRDLRYEKVSG